MKKLLALLLLLPLLAHAGSITGSIQTASSGAVVNGTLTFSLNQFAVVSGTAQVVATGVQCYTSTAGAITGEPDPQTAPVLSVNLGSGTLAAGTYFVKYTYFDATGESLPSPEASVTLVSQGTVIVAVPAIQPANATGWRVYISAATGTETRQSSQTGFAASYQQTAALSAGTALPGTNTSACSIRFTDELIPSTTFYTINLVNAQSSKIAGYPISQARFYGGTNGSVNVSSGWPVSIGGVIWPSPIVSTPNGNAEQSISSNLNLNGFTLKAANGVFSGNVLVGGTLGAASIAGNVQFTAATDVDLFGCYARVTTGVCVVPPGYSSSGTERSITAKANAGFLFMGPCTVNFGANTITDPVSVNGFSIISLGPQRGCNLNYTGTGTFFLAGANTADTSQLHVENIELNCSGAGNSSTCVDLVRLPLYIFRDNAVDGNAGASTTQKCVVLDGTNNFTGYSDFSHNRIQGCNSNLQLIGGANANVIIGTMIPGGNGTAPIGIDIQNGGGNIIIPGDIENVTTAIHCGAACSNNYMLTRDEVITNDFVFDSGSSGNQWNVVSSTANVVTDANAVSTNSGMVNSSSAGYILKNYGGLQLRPADIHGWDYFTHIATAGGFIGGKNAVLGWSNNLPTDGGAICISNDLVLGGLTVGACSTPGDSTGAWEAASFWLAGSTSGRHSITTPAIASGSTKVLPMNDGTVAKVFVTSDFTTANNTSLQAITGLTWTFPAVAGNYSFHCSLLYSQATAAVADQFGIQAATNNPTNIAASAIAYSSSSASTLGTVPTLATTTATPLVTFTPSATTTVFSAMMDGTLELAASANTVNIMVQTSAGADAVTVKRGSYCQLF